LGGVRTRARAERLARTSPTHWRAAAGEQAVRARAWIARASSVESHPLFICHVTPMGFAATETGVEVRRSNPTPSAILTHSFDPGGIQT